MMLTSKCNEMHTHYSVPTKSKQRELWNNYTRVMMKHGERHLLDCYNSVSQTKYHTYSAIAHECYTENGGEDMTIVSFNTFSYSVAYIVKLYDSENVSKYGYDIWDDIILVYHTKDNAWQFSVKEYYNENQYGDKFYYDM